MITFIQNGAFGTFNHVYQYSLHAGECFQAICRNEGGGSSGPAAAGARAVHVKARNRVSFMLAALRLARGRCVAVYFPGVSVLRLLRPKLALALDIRTFDVSRSRLRRTLRDILLNIEALLFSRVLVLSDSMKKNLWACLQQKVAVVPLGASSPADYLAGEVREKKEIILYVGTLNDRRISDTIPEIDSFLAEYRQWEYRIIGRGNAHEISTLNDAISRAENRARIHFLGEVRYPALAAFLAEARIGLCYIPITPWYDRQPPTKTLEYLAAGCAVVASATRENVLLLRGHAAARLIGNSVGELSQALAELEVLPISDSGYAAHSVPTWKDVYCQLLKVV